MALLNFSAPFSATPPPFFAAAAASAVSGLNTAAAVNTLLYGPRSPSFVAPPPPPLAPVRRPVSAPLPPPPSAPGRYYGDVINGGGPHSKGDAPPPPRPATYTRVEQPSDLASQQQAKTSLHAVLDYDDDFDDYNYEDEEPPPELPSNYRRTALPAVTPIQGPIFVKNGSVPVVPLYSYPVLNNGTFVQIPILWTALSVALGLEIRGEIIRGVPCIKRHHQLFCPTAGNSYPIDRIERFIDENKALMKRMYGEFQMNTEYGPPYDQQQQQQQQQPGRRSVKRETRSSTPTPPPDLHAAPGLDPVTDKSSASAESYFGKLRPSRQSFRNNNQSSDTGRVDACESKVEIVTPYWASNSAGKVRAIVNTQHFEQAIHQEVCSSKSQTKRCSGDCGCEQKYKWHRLLAYDPDNDCKGIFMDWFLFPSCCVCRCAPLFDNK